jgi:hypothetical protein
MHEPGGMDRFQARQQLSGDLSRPAEVQRPLVRKKFGERGAVHELHRHHLMAVLDNQVEHSADVCRDDLARATNLTPQEVPGAIVSDQVGSNRLERHFHAELYIEGMPDLSLTAATENAQKPVAATENHAGAKATGIARKGGDLFGILGQCSLALVDREVQQAPRAPAFERTTVNQRRAAVVTARRSRHRSSEI